MAIVLPYPKLDFVPLDVLTAAEMNQMVANCNALADFWNSDKSKEFIDADKIAARTITSAEIKYGTKFPVYGWRSELPDDSYTINNDGHIYAKVRIDTTQYGSAAVIYIDEYEAFHFEWNVDKQNFNFVTSTIVPIAKGSSLRFDYEHGAVFMKKYFIPAR